MESNKFSLTFVRLSKRGKNYREGKNFDERISNFEIVSNEIWFI